MAFGARNVANRLVRIQKIKSVHYELVVEMRRDTVRTLVKTLYQRYRRHVTQRQTTLSFVAWLIEARTFEGTFWHSQGTGLSLAVRRRMSIRYYNFLHRNELQFAENDLDLLWSNVAIAAAINAKRVPGDPTIAVYSMVTNAIPKCDLAAGVTYTFRADDTAPELTNRQWEKRLEEVLAGTAEYRTEIDMLIPADGE